MRRLILFLLPFLSANLLWAAPDTLVVGTKVAAPFVNETDQGLAGPSVWLWENVAREQGFVCTYRALPLDSLLLGLEQGHIDVCLPPLTITAEREARFDFTAPYYIAYGSVLQRSRSGWRKALSFLGSFFSLTFLRALGALVLVIGIFGLLIWLFERRRKGSGFGPGRRGLWDGFWWSAVTMTTVGYGDKAPQSLGGRIVAMVWMFTAIVIISGFTAAIASSLTMDRMGSAEGTIQDYKGRTLGTVRNSATSAWLRDHFFTQRKEYADMSELLAALDKGAIDAVAYDGPILQEVMATDSLDRYELVALTYHPQFYAFGLRQGLPRDLRERINTTMLGLLEQLEWRVLLAEHGLE